MKKKRIFLLLLSMAITSLSACGKKDEAVSISQSINTETDSISQSINTDAASVVAESVSGESDSFEKEETQEEDSTSVETESSQPDSDQVTEESQESESEQVDYQSALDTLLSEYALGSQARYQLVYIDDDEIPEVVIADSDERINDTLKFYVLIDGRYTYTKSIGCTDMISYQPYKNRICSWFDTEEDFKVAMYSYNPEIQNFEQYSLLEQDMIENRYFDDGKEITEIDFSRAVTIRFDGTRETIKWDSMQTW